VAAVRGTLLGTTEEHPFWSVTDGRFERADELTAGEHILSASGRTMMVDGLRLVTSRTEPAYNLEIDGIHTYHVGVNEVLVHNDCKEVVLGQFDHYEQARNKALELLGEIDPSTREVMTGRLAAATTTYGKPIGFTTRVNGTYKAFRMGYDPVKGPHISVVVGKGAKAQKWAVPWSGTEQQFANLLRGNT
jgi:hypothetical protein